MDQLAKRGSKRRCLNDQCARPFYDLNRATFACPDCGTAFVVAAAPPAPERTSWRTGRRFARAPRAELPVEQAPDAIDEILPGAADDADLAATNEADVLLEVEEAEPIEPTPGTAGEE